MAKLINITHTDTDGIGCGVICGLFAQRYGMQLEVHYCGYGAVTDQLKAVIDHVDDHPDDHGIQMLIISDISIKEDTNVDVLLNRMVKAHPEITVKLLDHHGTASWLNKYDWAQVSETDDDGVRRCGTYWVYSYLSEFFRDYKQTRLQELNNPENTYTEWDDDGPAPLDPDPIVDYVLAVDLYDTWKWVEDYPADHPMELAVDLDRLLKIKGAEEMHREMMDRLSDFWPKYYIYHGYQSCLVTTTDQVLIYYKQLEINRAIETKRKQLLIGTYEFKVHGNKQFALIRKHFIQKYPKDSKKLFKALNQWQPGSRRTFNVGVVYCSDYMSEIGNALSKEHPELDFIIMVTMPWNISCRTCKDLDIPLGVIANGIGNGQGGGHEKSAGTTIKFATSKGMLENLINGLDLQ